MTEQEIIKIKQQKKEFLKNVYQNQINFLRGNIAEMQLRLGFDSKEPDTGEPDRKFLKKMIKEYEKHIKKYKEQIEELKNE